MRHNRFRDLEDELMREVCSDVKVEPHLLPLADNNIVRGNTADNARLDVSGNGVWGPAEKTFLDIRVMHPNSPSYLNKEKIGQVYKMHEREKNRRITKELYKWRKVHLRQS